MKGRIVVVEDDDGILGVLEDALNMDDYEVVGIRHPDDVLEEASRDKPDLFLIDVMLPDQSGIEVADRLWLSGFGDVPMIAISASSIMRDVARHCALFQTVLNKPFSIRDLAQTIEQAVERKKAEAP